MQRMTLVVEIKEKEGRGGGDRVSSRGREKGGGVEAKETNRATTALTLLSEDVLTLIGGPLLLDLGREVREVLPFLSQEEQMLESAEANIIDEMRRGEWFGVRGAGGVWVGGEEVGVDLRENPCEKKGHGRGKRRKDEPVDLAPSSGTPTGLLLHLGPLHSSSSP
jgi:hypothetical protein